MDPGMARFLPLGVSGGAGRLALEFEGGVGDGEPLADRRLHGVAGRLRLLQGRVTGQHDVAGEGADLARQARGGHIGEHDARRHRLEQDVGSLPEQLDGPHRDQHGDGE
jgi:hypothetical protein